MTPPVLERPGPHRAERRSPLVSLRGLAALLVGMLAVGCGRTVTAADARAADEAADEGVVPADAGPPAAPGPCTDSRACGGLLRTRGGAIRYFATHSPFVRDERVTRVVVFVHGIGGSASSNFDTAVAAATRAESSGVDPAARTDTLIFAPSFPNEAAEDAPPGGHRWTRTGWAVGEASVTRPRASSFSILDGIVRDLVRSGRFPNLREVVVAGHSAGGQLAQRYAATNRVEGELPPTVRMRYVVANPSSFLYLNPARPYFTAGPPGFGEPYARGPASQRFAGAPRCPDKYDRYRYGLRDLNPYAAATGAEAIARQYPGRDVTYLAGDRDRADLDCEDESRSAQRRCRRQEEKNNDDLDMSCAAVLQGEDRLARATRYAAFLDTFFPGHHHRLVTVPGAGHSAKAMFDSNEGVAALFGRR